MGGNTDLLIILGSKLSSDWQLSKLLKHRLDYAIKLYKNNPNIQILVCGRYSIAFDWLDITPLAFESVEMKKYLVLNGIPANKVNIENKSKDTISNIYFAKQFINTHSQYKNIAVLCSKMHSKRVKILTNKIFGDGYNIEITYDTSAFEEINNDLEEYEISKILDKNSFLAEVNNGNDKPIKYQLFRNKHYSISRQDYLANF